MHRLPGGPRGLSGATGPAGPAGVAGATGAIGPAGPQGTAGTNGTNGATDVKVTSREESVGPNTDHSFLVSCPGNSVATGGGFAGQLAATAKVVSSMPSFGMDDRPTGWQIRVYNSGASPILARVFVVCASP